MEKYEVVVSLISSITSMSALNVKEIYENKLVSHFVPPEPNSNVLKVLALSRLKQTSNIYDAYGCTHLFYGSPEQFVHHILWLLHPKSSQHPLIGKLISNMSYLTTLTNMCTNCVNSLLFTVRFIDVINLYSIQYRELQQATPTHNLLHIIRNLYLNVFSQPKMYRIMMKACSLNKRSYLAGEKISAMYKQMGTEGQSHDFDYLCDVFISELHQHHSFTTRDSSINDYALDNQMKRQFVFIRTLYLSMKYWNKYHLLFFLKHYLMDLEQAWHDLWRVAHLLKQNHHGNSDTATLQHIHDITIIIGSVVAFVCEKAQKLRCKDIGDVDVQQTILKYLNLNRNKETVKKRKDMRKFMKNGLLSFAWCNWYRCNKRQREMEETLKLCKRCKMAYYCSRRCQKKAWKYHHRNACVKLQEYYGMS
eukprot:408634_1